MSCQSCHSTKGGTPAGCRNNGSCMTQWGCQKKAATNWLSDIPGNGPSAPFNKIEIRFKGGRKEFYLNPNALDVYPGEPVMVEGNSGGQDMGHVGLTGELVRMQLKKAGMDPESTSFKKILRKATERDLDSWQKAKSKEEEVMLRSRQISREMGLDMKIGDVDFQGDGSRAVFYYTADGRVDFRELIKKLGSEFGIRIEMRQISPRQEAGRLGAIGSCGRELCCSTWLTHFKPVSTTAARYQNLSINNQKLSGQCGKLKCCLNYELDLYMEAMEAFPRDLHYLPTRNHRYPVVKTDIFRKVYLVEDDRHNLIAVPLQRAVDLVKWAKKGQPAADLLAPDPEGTDSLIVRKAMEKRAAGRTHQKK